MTLPLFSASDDPGPSLAAVLERMGASVSFDFAGDADKLAITHGTTVVAVRYDGGVVLAGDRRATSGNLISHRTMEKVFPADGWSGVAIAGAAGPAIEMVKMFQLQLEHYEKVEGHSLSIEGKANQLSQMVRNHLPAAMQGLAVAHASLNSMNAGGWLIAVYVLLLFAGPWMLLRLGFAGYADVWMDFRQRFLNKQD